MQLLFLQQWLPQEVLKAISWTFIHSLWQGLLAAMLAAAIILSTRKSSARLRYNLLGMVVILFLTATLLTFSRQLKNGVLTEKQITPFPEIDPGDPAITFNPVPAASTNVTGELVRYLNTNADLFVLIWAVFFLVNCMKLITGFAGVHRIRHYKTHPVPDDWQVKLESLSKRLGIQQSVRLLQSGLVKVPVAIGLFKPVVLVPLGLLSHLPPEQVETILLHELAHVRRKDYLLNILQRLTETVFFFNPALIWISSLIRQEREACCDDIVVANTCYKGSYLEALVSFQEYSLTPSGYAMAISTKRHYLFNRVKRMVTRENKKLNLMEKIFLIIGAAALTAFTFIQKVNNDKKDISVVEKAGMRAEVQPVPLPQIQARVPAITRKPAVKKENSDPVLEISVTMPAIDTVPDAAKKNEREKAVRGEKDGTFRSMSSTINKDGNTKTETTTLTDEDGKKIIYTKLNDKLTSLSVDGKIIPESEYGNYSGLFEKIEKRKQENMAKREADIERRKKDIERRKMDIERRKEDIAKRNEDRKKELTGIHEKRIQAYKEKTEKNAREKEKIIREKEKLDKEKRKIIKEKEKINKEKEKTVKPEVIEKNGQKKIVPAINGREIVGKDLRVESSINAVVAVHTDISNEVNKKLQEVQDIHIEELKKVTRNNEIVKAKQKDAANQSILLRDREVQILQKVNLSVGVKTELLKQFDYKLNDTYKTKPGDQNNGNYTPKKPPVPPQPDAKPVKEAQPPKPGPELLRYRPIT